MKIKNEVLFLLALSVILFAISITIFGCGLKQDNDNNNNNNAPTLSPGDPEDQITLHISISYQGEAKEDISLRSKQISITWPDGHSWRPRIRENDFTVSSFFKVGRGADIELIIEEYNGQGGNTIVPLSFESNTVSLSVLIWGDRIEVRSVPKGFEDAWRR